MRRIVTVIDMPRAESADVVVEASPEITVDALAREIGRRGVPPVVYIAGRAVDPRATLAEAPVFDGLVDSVRRRRRCNGIIRLARPDLADDSALNVAVSRASNRLCDDFSICY